MSSLKFPEKQLSYQDQQFSCRHCCASQGHWPQLAAARSGFNHVIRGRARASRVTSTLNFIPGTHGTKNQDDPNSQNPSPSSEDKYSTWHEMSPGRSIFGKPLALWRACQYDTPPIGSSVETSRLLLSIAPIFKNYSVWLFEKMTLILLIRDSYFIKKRLFSITQINVFYSIRESQISCFQTTLVF